MSRVGVAVYDRAGVLVADLDPETWWTSGDVFLDELDDTGAFAINVQADDPDVAAIEPGHIFVVSLDAASVWRGVIRKSLWREVADDEAGRYATFSGVGEVGRLGEMTVYPTGGLGRFPFSDDRAFNWTAPEFDDSGWDTAVVTPANYGTASENYGLPEGFPDGDAGWIWSVDSSAAVPGGIKYMRSPATAVATAAVYEAWSAADDTNEVWIEGTSVLKSSDGAYDGRTTPVELYVTAGTITAAAKVENLNALKAGLLFSLLQPLDAAGTPLVNTGSDWLVKPDADPLGMTAGEILVLLLGEFTARGGVSPAVTFTTALDSDGNAWDTWEEVTVPVGATYLEVLRQLVELEMCDFRMSPGSFTLDVYNAGGAGAVVAYTLDDTSLTSLTWESAPAVSTALLTRWARGWTDEDDAALVTAHGRREAVLSLGGVTSEATAQSQSDIVIARFGTDRTEIAASIDPAALADEPYTKYGPGDSIWTPAPPSAFGVGDGVWDGGDWNADLTGATPERVMAVGMGIDDVGNPTWAVHLNSHIEEIEKRQQVLLKRLAGGSVAGRSQSSTVPYEPRALKPREPATVVFSWYAGEVVAGVDSGPFTFTRAVRIREVRVLPEPASSSGNVVVVASKGGTTFSTVTAASGADSAYETSEEIFQQRIDVLKVEATSVGTGVEKLTVEVVFA